VNIIFLSCGFFFLSSIFVFFSSPVLSCCRFDVYHTSTHGVALNLGCKSETCCTRLAENTGRIKSPKIRHLRTIAQFCRALSLQLKHVSTIGKNLLNSSISPTCPHNMVNFGPLVAEIGWQVWVTPANVNGFRVLAASLHGTRSERQLDCSVEQRAPPIFGRLAMTLGIGSHSSYIFISLYHMFGCNQYFLLLCSKNSLFVLFTFSKLRYMNVLLHHFVS